MNDSTLHELVNQRATVRAYDGADGLICEGEVIAVCFVPSLTIETADGRRHHVASTQRIERQTWEKL